MLDKRKIRSSRLSLKFANSNKIDIITDFINEYKRVVQIYTDAIWIYQGDLPLFMPKDFIKIETTLSARAKQCAANQAKGIVTGIRAEINNLKKRAKWYYSKGQNKKARKCEFLASSKIINKPIILNIEPRLDKRFFEIIFSENKDFDIWLCLKSTGFKKIFIPLKKHKHFNAYLTDSNYKLLNSIDLSTKYINFNFERKSFQSDKSGISLGIDIGYKSAFSTSNKEQFGQKELEKICEKLARRKKGSNGYKRAIEHRKNLTNFLAKKIKFLGVKEVRIENIKNLHHKCKASKKISKWSYRELFAAIESRAEREGVPVVRISPAFTSQRCSDCGWVQKRNRKGEQFKCVKCGFAHNADLNASRNIALDLSVLPRTAVKRRANLKGFYWPVNAHEPTVREANKAEDNTCQFRDGNVSTNALSSPIT